MAHSRGGQMLVLMVGMGSLFLLVGLGLVVLRDYLANTFRDPEEVERYLHLDLLASVPRYEADNAHLVTEAYQNLRTALLFARHDERGQVVLVTGTAPQEGKTTTIVNLAKLLAGSGEKTIVLDCDLRRAQLHHRLALDRERIAIGGFEGQRLVGQLDRLTVELLLDRHLRHRHEGRSVFRINDQRRFKRVVGFDEFSLSQKGFALLQIFHRAGRDLVVRALAGDRDRQGRGRNSEAQNERCQTHHHLQPIAHA